MVMLPCLCKDAPSEPSCSQHVYFAPSEPSCSQHVEFAPSEPCCSAGWVAKVHLPEPSCSTSGLSFEYISLLMITILVTCALLKIVRYGTPY